MKLPTTPNHRSTRKQGAYLAAVFALGSVCAFAQAVANQDAADEASQKAASDKAATQKQKTLSADLKKSTTATDTATPAAQADDATIQMDPFVVETEKNQGYQASNTMGSRLNTKIDDMAASMSVVTKEQLNDFALVDINDIFAMEMNTQGTKNYTANSNTGGGGAEVDDVAVNTTTANRIRGLSSADISVGNFSASSTVPIDSYNVDAVEISRGPNSSIFGTGGAGGGVNLVPASANLQKDLSSGSIMVSSIGTVRTTLSLNRPIFKNVLALRVMGEATNQQYNQKPSYDKTRRTTVTTTFRPHKTTTLRASWEKLDEKYDRPNSYTPRNLVSAWQASGSPSWDPSSSTYSYYNADGSIARTGTVALSNNASQDPYALTMTGVATPSSGQVWVSTIGTQRARPTLGISQGQPVWFYPSQWGANNISTTSNTTASGNQREIAMVRFASYYNVPAAYQSTSALGFPSFTSTTDSNFYNWKKINIAGANYGHKTGETKRIELEQYFLQTERHTLAAQIGFYKEVITDYRRVFIGSGAGSSGSVTYDLQPDVNVKLPDGSMNPNYGSAYIGGFALKTFTYPINNQTQKINLVYQLDLSHEKNWFLRQIGKQRLLGYKEYNISETATVPITGVDQVSSPLTGYWASVNSLASNQTTVAVTGPTGMITQWNPYGTLRAGNNGNAVWNTRYYVGDNSGRVLYGTSSMNASSLNYNLYGNTTGYTKGADGNYLGSTTGANKLNSYIYTNATGPFSWYNVNESIATELTGSGNMAQSIYRTSGMVWQGFLFDDRILPTIGARKDTLRTRYWSSLSAVTDIDPTTGFYGDVTPAWNFAGNPWKVFNATNGATEAKGITHTKGLVVKPFKWLSLSYNKADSQKPVNYAIDFQGNPLPNPYGTTTDYGFSLFLFRNKLNVRVKHYETKASAARMASNSAFNRILLMDYSTASASTNYSAFYWYEHELATSKNYTIGTDAVQDAAIESQTWSAIGLDKDFTTNLSNSTTAMTSDETSKGYEIELNYNPTRFWTLRATAAETEAVTSNIAGSYQIYRDARFKLWNTLTSPNDGTLFWNHFLNTYSQTVGQYYYSTIENPSKLLFALQGKPKPQVSKYSASFMSSYNLAGMSRNRYIRNFTLGGNVRWQARQSIGFYGASPEADGIVRSYDANRPIYVGSQKHLDLFVVYNFKMYKDRIKSRLQLNVSDVLESGHLQPFSARPDGSIYGYRIVDPREYKLTWSFDL